MDNLGRMHLGLWMVLLMGGAGEVVRGQTVPASAATAPVTPAPLGTAPAGRRPTVDELLASRKPVPFDFTNTPINDVMAYVAKSYDLEFVNKYDMTDRLTMKEAGNLTARQAINYLNGAIMAMGYTVVESVRGDPPRIVLTVVPTKTDAGTLVTVYYGSDPAAIPEGDTRRTQVMSFTNVDPEKARAMILGVVGDQADVTVNPSTRSIVITDTATHVHTAAALLQVLEKQAGDKK